MSDEIEPLTEKEYEQMMKYREKGGRMPEFVKEIIRRARARKAAGKPMRRPKKHHRR